MMFIKPLTLLAILSAVLFASVACEQKHIKDGDHDIVIDTDTKEPEIDLMVDSIHVKGTYYEKTIKGADYPQARKDFDIKLVNAITEFGYNFAHDIVIKNSYTVVFGPKYTAKLTALIATYLPEFLRQEKAGGPKVKDGFIGDALTIWTKITKDVMVNKEKKYQLDTPKDPEDYMKRLRVFMDAAVYTVKNNPVGIYVDWRNLTLDGKSIAEYAAPLVTYLRDHGYKNHIAILDKLMMIVGKIKPSSDPKTIVESAKAIEEQPASIAA